MDKAGKNPKGQTQEDAPVVMILLFASCYSDENTLYWEKFLKFTAGKGVQAEDEI